MKASLVSLNVSEVKTVDWKGQSITTGIFKYPVKGPQKVEGVNIVGDDQADRRVHGGIYKAIYGYPLEHYAYWKKLYPELEFHHGMFGENFTSEGLIESELYIGDKLKFPDAEFMVVQPRMPCYKLGIKFGTQKIIKQFVNAKKPGYYLRIIQEGEVEAGQEIQLLENPDRLLTVVDIVDLIRRKATDELLERVLSEEYLPPGLKQHILGLYLLP